MSPDHRPRRRLFVIGASLLVPALVAVGVFAASQRSRSQADPSTTSVRTVESSEPGTTAAATDSTDAAAGGPVPSVTRTSPPTTTTTVVRVVVVRPPATTTTVVADDGRGYEANRPLIALSPTTVRAGRTVEFEVKKFPKRASLLVSVANQAGVVQFTVSLRTGTDGSAKGRFNAPARGAYTVTATTTSPTASAVARLTVT